MRKLILFAMMFLPGICIAGTTDYYNLQHYSVVVDTINVNNDYYYRGGFHVGYDTQALSASDINTQFDIFTSSVVISTSTYLIDDEYFSYGTNGNFSQYYDSTTGELRISTSTITTDYGAALWRITNSSYVVIGSTASFTELDGKGDLGVADELIVKGSSIMQFLNAQGIIQADDRINLFGAGILFAVSAADTEANWKLFEPVAAGLIVRDTTNKSIIISTGTAAGSFGLITDGTTLPTGW